MPACDPEKFIDRDQELDRVMKRVSDLADGKPFAPKERVFHFVGPSRIGKSCLLEKIRHELIGRQLKCVPLLIPLDALKAGKRGFTVELLVKVYEEFCTHKGIKPPSINSQTTQNEIVRQVQRVVNGKDQLVILLMDEINIPPEDDMKRIEEHLLFKFIHNNKLAVLVTAGRSQPSIFNDFALRPNASNTHHLPVFDEEKTSEQMEVLKPGSKQLAGKVQKLGNGVPGNTVELVSHIAGEPLDIPNEAQAVRSLLNDVKKENKISELHIPMLEALSIMEGFFPEDVAPLFQRHPQLGAGWDERRVKEEFLRLKEIKVGPGGVVDWDRERKHWAMDERTRDLFERELQMREPPELWRKLHCTALEMYRAWGEKYNSDVYRNKSSYHQQRLQSAGLDCSDLEG
jgi:hypothetical protein